MARRKGSEAARAGSAGPVKATRAGSARPARAAAARPRPEPSGLPESFIEVRVAAGRVDVIEFYSHGRSARLREVLRRLGLETRPEFDSPCG